MKAHLARVGCQVWATAGGGASCSAGGRVGCCQDVATRLDSWKTFLVWEGAAPPTASASTAGDGWRGTGTSTGTSTGSGRQRAAAGGSRRARMPGIPRMPGRPGAPEALPRLSPPHGSRRRESLPRRNVSISFSIGRRRMKFLISYIAEEC